MNDNYSFIDYYDILFLTPLLVIVILCIEPYNKLFFCIVFYLYISLMKWIKLFESFTQDELIEKANVIFKMFHLQKLKIDYNPEKCLEDYKKTGNWNKLKIAILLERYFKPYLVVTNAEGSMMKYDNTKSLEFEKLKDSNLKKRSSELYIFDWWTELFLKWNQDLEVLEQFIKTSRSWFCGVAFSGNFPYYPHSLSSTGYQMRKRLIDSMKMFAKYKRKKIRFPPNI